MRNHIVRFTAIALFALPVVSPRAFAVSKEMVQLQTQVQQLQDMVQHLQTSNDERMGVIVNLVQQNTDNVNRMMASVNALQTSLKMENEQRGTSNTQLSTQIQSLNDSVDELKTRIANLTTQMQSIQGQLQNVNGMPAQPGGAPPPAGSMPVNQGPGGQAMAPAPALQRLRRLLSTSSTRVLCATITPPSTALRCLNLVTSFAITLRTHWPETPNFIWAKSITGKASTRRRSRHMTPFWSSIQAIPKRPPPNCARDSP